MKVQATDKTTLTWNGDTLAVGLFVGGVTVTGELAELDKKLAGTIKELIAETDFDGKFGNNVITRVGGDCPVRKIMLVGLGDADEFKLDSVRLAGGAIARLAKSQRSQNLAISLPIVNNNPSLTAQAITEGITIALYEDRRFKSEEESTPLKLETVELLELGEQQEAITKAEKICEGVILAKQLVDAPANNVDSVTLATLAQELASEYGLEIEILEKEDCEKMGMGAYLGVAKASDVPPKFIHLTYKPQGTPRRKVAIVGKGITFDSGGLNLKPSGSGIETMKMDMGGAGATFGAAKAIAELKPDVEVHFISAATENMISGHAMHPGDILTASNGKTIEVNNTDAEGRLTLADALVFAEKLGVDAIVDLATLTGACVIALGDDIGGLWSSDDLLADQLKNAADLAGEKMWQMPLEDKYFEGLKSQIADMKNVGPRQAGSITAALFLKQFVNETPWAHLDIAGPAWIDQESGINNAGATGFPVRTLVNWVCN